jgi:hypothetical protein
MQQADGIRATRNGDADAIASGEHAMPFDGLDHAVEQDDFIVDTR